MDEPKKETPFNAEQPKTMTAELDGISNELRSGTDHIMKALDRLREIAADSLREPTMKDYYIPRDGTPILVEHRGGFVSGWQYWRAPFEYVKDKLSEHLCSWDAVLGTLPESAFPLIPMSRIETLGFAYTLAAPTTDDMEADSSDRELYVPRNGMGLLVEKLHWGNWVIYKPPFWRDTQLVTNNTKENGFLSWENVKDVLPESAFPLIPFKDIGSLRFAYTLKKGHTE